MEKLEEFENDTVFIVLRWMVVSMIFAPLMLSFAVPFLAAVKVCAIALVWELIGKKKYAA
jgi:hypothetical protein